MADLTDLEIVRRCAEAMGWRAFKEKRGNYTLCVTVAPGERLPWERKQKPDPERYTEVTLKEAERIGYFGRGLPKFLHDKAQAMELVERFDMTIERERDNTFGVTLFKDAFKKGSQTFVVRQEPDLCMAVCLCVAKMKGEG